VTTIVYKNHVQFCMLIWFSSTAYYPYGGLGFGHHRHEHWNQYQRNNICMHIIFLACTTWYYISKSSCPDSIQNRVCFSKVIPKSQFCPWSRKCSYMCDCLVERTLCRRQQWHANFQVQKFRPFISQYTHWF
jgi:hypothetical protein